MQANIGREVAALKRMTVKELRGRYLEVFGEQARSGNKDFLWKRIAWRIQALAEGDLSERARRRAEELAMVERADRSRSQFDYQVDVAVQKKFSQGDAAELDPLVGLAEQIAAHFSGRRLDAGSVEALCVKTEHAPVYAPEHIDELRPFTSVLTLTFRVVR